MAELEAGRPVPFSARDIPARVQLLAVAWLRWRIFVNNTFRRRSSGQGPGGRTCVRHPRAHHRLAVSRADGDWSDWRQWIPGMDHDRRQPSAAPGSAPGRHHGAVAICKRQRPKRRCGPLQFRSVIADPLSSALWALSCSANLHRTADAEHHCGLPGIAGRGYWNRFGETCAGAACSGGSRGVRADEYFSHAHDRRMAGALACQSPLPRDLQRVDGAVCRRIPVPELSACSDACCRRQKHLGTESSAQFRNWPAMVAAGLRRECDSSAITSFCGAGAICCVAGEHSAVRGNLRYQAAQAVSRRISE